MNPPLSCCEIAQDVQDRKQPQGAGSTQEAEIASCSRHRVWERKLSCMTDPQHRENQADQVQEVRTQTTIVFKQAEQDEEYWQVLSQIALCLHDVAITLRSAWRKVWVDERDWGGSICHQLTLAFRTMSCLPPSPCMTPLLARVNPTRSAK